MAGRPDLDDLERRLQHQFTDRSLLRRALAHRSWCSEHLGEPSNERLEFLGDAVLGWVVADLVFTSLAEVDEGRLTDARKSVVNATALAEIATELDLGPELLLGRGEAAAGGREKVSILSDALEAVIGAIYLDGGADAARRFVERLVSARLEAPAEAWSSHDAKTELQELTARLLDASPRYSLTETGPDHAKTFFAEVSVGDVAVGSGEVLGRGEGRTKKQAEQAAARAARAALLGRVAGEAGDPGLVGTA